MCVTRIFITAVFITPIDIYIADIFIARVKQTLTKTYFKARTVTLVTFKDLCQGYSGFKSLCLIKEPS